MGLVTFDLETGVINLPINFGVSGRFVLDLSANTCQTRHVNL